MRRTLTIGTIGILAVAAAVMAIAGLTAPKTNATSSLCHSTSLSIAAPSSVKSGKRIAVTGAEARTPAHGVTATLQSRLSTAKKWVNGASGNLSSSGAYSLKWKAPSKKGQYKLRVRVAHAGASNTSAIRTVRVK